MKDTITNNYLLWLHDSCGWLESAVGGCHWPGLHGVVSRTPHPTPTQQQSRATCHTRIPASV